MDGMYFGHVESNRSLTSLSIPCRGAAIGVLLGWHYPTEGTIYSLLLPKGQDAEFTGFYVYCTQILVWLPPLIFSGLVQTGVSQSFGVFAVAMFGAVAVGIISCFPKWETMLSVFHSEEQNDVELEKIPMEAPTEDHAYEELSTPTQVPSRSSTSGEVNA